MLFKMRFASLVLFSWLAMSGSSFAQSAIAGVVKDTSGAVLPGVTVEASSPALIEKSRSVVTDSQGQYKIVDLRPGTYAVMFTLAGFRSATAPLCLRTAGSRARTSTPLSGRSV
jgi:hypothetical protein